MKDPLFQGDSGGPLVCPDDNGDWIQAGLASYGAANDIADEPGVFTRVAAYKSFIDEYVKQ